MRRIFPAFLLILFLSGCANISVQDFGPYWNRSSVDSSLIGYWKNPKDKDQGKIRVLNVSGTYQVDYLGNNGLEQPDASLRARALHVGSYHFMLIKMQDRTDHWMPFMLYRYTAEGNELRDYHLDPDKMKTFLARKYPKQSNVTAVICKDKKSLCKSHINIEKLDSEALAILASIPDNKAFWSVDNISRRLR